MQINKIDPRTKLYLFAVTCAVVMGTSSSLFSAIYTTFIMLLGIYLGEYKGLKKRAVS